MAVLNCACKKVVTCYPNGFNFPLLWLAAWQMWFTKNKMVQRGKKSMVTVPHLGKPICSPMCVCPSQNRRRDVIALVLLLLYSSDTKSNILIITTSLVIFN